ncbi:MAG: hypothetical protein ACD_8C00146G0001 [uncultured bacterium]|nr:MAG: hypothetical protein ACD_8C00146G0001 [uncultured bacterium]
MKYVYFVIIVSVLGYIYYEAVKFHTPKKHLLACIVATILHLSTGGLLTLRYAAFDWMQIHLAITIFSLVIFLASGLFLAKMIMLKVNEETEENKEKTVMDKNYYNNLV